MSNNNDDDFEDDDDGLDLESEGFDEFEKQGNTLGEMWRNNPMVKVGAVIGVAAVIFFVIFSFGGETERTDPSLLPAGSDVSAPPGTEEASEAYVAAVEEQNEERVLEAFQSAGSALPTPTQPPRGSLELAEEPTQEEDPLQRWRRLQQERLERELQQQPAQDIVPQPVDTGPSEAVQAMADLMSEQMQAILESRGEPRIQSRVITTPEVIETAAGRGNAGSLGGNQSGGDDFDTGDDGLEDLDVVLVPAGEIVYAQLLTEANTDAPGPVLAQVLSGPLSGARVLGSFEQGRDVLTLNFDTVVLDGESISVNAVALDPDTTLPGMATEVDHRYLQRIVLPAAAAFVEGTANAIAESGRTSITITGETVSESEEDASTEQEVSSGVEEAGQELREILDEMADDTQILVRIEAGTPMGILFLQPVVDNGS